MPLTLNYQGRMLDPLNLQINDLVNIGMHSAVTLSRLQRFWCQCRESYTVAQHCLSLVEQAKKDEYDKEILVWLLIHETYEALTGMDIPSPVKHSPANEAYVKAEEKCLEMMAIKYGLTPPIPQIIKALDNRVMVMEAEALMPYVEEMNWQKLYGEPYGQLYKLGANEREIRNDFIKVWQELLGTLQ